MGKNKIATAVVVAAATVLAGCSSSGGGATPGASNSSAPQTSTSSAAAAGSEWVIGSICSCGGALASSLGGTGKALQAWADSVNAAGGINGHKIKLILKDDAGNPTTSLTQARELIEQDHVIAIVGAETNFIASWNTIAAKAGVPIIGGQPSSATNIADPNSFPVAANPLTINLSDAIEPVNQGHKKLAFLYCAESPACAQAVTFFGAAAKIAGGEVVTSAKVAATAADYTAQCLQVKNSGADAFEVGSASAIVLRVIDACVQQGVTAVPVEPDGTITANWTKDKNLEGFIGPEDVAPWFDTNNPAIAAFQDVMKKYAPDVFNSDLFGPNVAYAYVSGKMFEAAAKAGNLGDNPTSADVKNGLYALHDETLGGLTGPITYIKGQGGALVTRCYWPVTIKNGEFVALNNGQPTCIDKSKYEPFLKGSG